MIDKPQHNIQNNIHFVVEYLCEKTLIKIYNKELVLIIVIKCN